MHTKDRAEALPSLADMASVAAVERRNRVLTLTSFGFDHGPVPVAERTEDVRRWLRDPARARDGGILDMDGRDEFVQKIVMTTPGAVALVANLLGYVVSCDVSAVAIGCVGGRHRSVALVEDLAGVLRRNFPEIEVVVVHRDVHHRRIVRDGEPGAGR